MALADDIHMVGDDVQHELEAGAGPVDELAGIAAVGPDQPDAAECSRESFQQWLGAVAVLHAGGGDQYAQQQTQRVDGDVVFAAVDLPTRIVATAGPAADGMASRPSARRTRSRSPSSTCWVTPAFSQPAK
jgi:hypothetical protein